MRYLIIAILAGFWATTAHAADRALDLAVRSGDLAAAQRAITQGEALDARTPPFLITPLALAAVRGDLPMVRLLLSAGADPNAPGHRGMNALSAATRSCRAGPGVIRALIDAGADLEDRSGASMTPLMTAIQEHRFDVALMLLQAGADVNTRNSFGDGVLNYAIYAQHNGVVRAALRQGVDTGQLALLFASGVHYYPGLGRMQPHARATCADQS